jgi:hypothetical protein
MYIGLNVQWRWFVDFEDIFVRFGNVCQFHLSPEVGRYCGRGLFDGFTTAM